MAKFKVVVTDDRYNDYDVEKSVLDEIGAELVVNKGSSEEDLIEACRDADGILCNLNRMTAKVVGKLEKCRVISRYGVGYDNVDVKACTDKGIYLTNVPDYCAEEVSDHALALLMCCARKVAKRDAQVRKGMWDIGSKDPIYRIAGKTFTFIGFGKIGKCLYRKIKGLDLSRILIYDPYLDAETIKSFGAEKADFETALREADFVSLHLPLNEKTKSIMDGKALSLLKKTAVIINTSRGPLIDEDALFDALKKGEISYAGLDVHIKEPMDPKDPLMKLDNCLLTDHVGWYSEESIHELKRKAAENVRDVLLCKEPKYKVNDIEVCLRT
jgi:D-3-phosphoglycerate dehydrogenase